VTHLGKGGPDDHRLRALPGCRQGVDPVSVEEAAGRHTHGGFIRLGMFEPAPTSWPGCANASACTNSPSRDAQTFHMRPKVEAYDGDVQLVILRTQHGDQRAAAARGMLC
jgi:magnesium transporter